MLEMFPGPICVSLIPKNATEVFSPVTEGADWPVQRSAMEAVVRRYRGAKNEGLRISKRRARGAPMGNVLSLVVAMA